MKYNLRDVGLTPRIKIFYTFVQMPPFPPAYQANEQPMRMVGLHSERAWDLKCLLRAEIPPLCASVICDVMVK